MDTVDLYFIRSRQRRLSLRFLAWYVLKENIQTDTHDSIEDALSALKLYKTFLDLESDDIFDDKLEELYKEGKQYVSVFISSWLGIVSHACNEQNFKPPPPPGQTYSQGSTASSGSGVATPHTGMMTPPYVMQGGMMQQTFLSGFNPMALGGGMLPHPSFFSPSPPPRGPGSSGFGQHSNRSWRG